MLLAMTGLPGTGKSEIARAVAVRLPAALLSMDAITAALRAHDEASHRPDKAAYAVIERVAAYHLELGIDVVIDGVAPFEWLRRQLADIATARSQPFVLIEVVCSDLALHLARVEARLELHPDSIRWQDVEQQRDSYEPPPDPSLVIDTATSTIEESVAAAVQLAYRQGRVAQP